MFNLKKAVLKNKFLLSAQRGEAERLKAFIRKGIDVNLKDMNGSSALMHAVSNGHKEAVAVLLKNGAEVNATNFLGRTPLMFAGWSENKGIVEILMKNGANIFQQDLYNDKPLNYSVVREVFEEMESKPLSDMESDIVYISAI